MLLINRAQNNAMLSANPRLLSRAIAEGVRENYPQLIENIPNDLLAEMIAHGIRAADSFGFTDPEAIAGFVCIMFEVGPEFYRHPSN